MASKRNWANSGGTGLPKLLEEDSKEKSIFLCLRSPVSTWTSYRWRQFVPQINPVQQFSSEIQKQSASESCATTIYTGPFKQQTKQTVSLYSSCLGDGGSRYVTTGL